jgi:TIR domain-containing protein
VKATSDDHDLFVSYSRHDAPTVNQVASQLEQLGLRVWLDEVEIVAGDNIVERIQEGIASSRYFVAFLSNHYNRSLFAKEELAVAVMHLLSEGKRAVIPVRLDDDPLPTILLARKYCDFRTSFLTGFKELTQALSIQSETPSRLLLGETVTMNFSREGSLACWDYERDFELGRPVSNLKELSIYADVQPSNVNVKVGRARLERETGLFAIYSDHDKTLPTFQRLRQELHYELTNIYGDPSDEWFYGIPRSSASCHLCIRFPRTRLPAKVSAEFEREGSREDGPEIKVENSRFHQIYTCHLVPHHSRYKSVYFSWTW